jgi:hypothetical protein
VVNLSCVSKPVDLRTLAPAESLVYLETPDLAAALQPIVDSEAFTKAATGKPDLAALKGVPVAVAVTGFETSEEKLTDENSIARVQPRFVVIADTRAWNYQAVAFAEQKLGSFVSDLYKSEPALERSEKHGGKYLKWTAEDGRKAYALVIESLIFFGNDESAIDKSIAVRSGQADSFAKTGKLETAASGALASGFISTEGIGQIANIIGLQLATDASEESEVQSAIAALVPQLIRGWITEVRWTQTRTERGIEDRWRVTMPPETAKIFAETMAPANKIDEQLLPLVPSDAITVTQYNLDKPQIAWRSLVLSAQQAVDERSKRLIAAMTGLLFDPYGYSDGELFLSSIEPGLLTVRYEDESEVAVIARLRDRDNANKALDPETQTTAGAIFEAAANGIRISGDPEVVAKCSHANNDLAWRTRFAERSEGIPSVRTRTRDTESAGIVAQLLSERKAAADTISFTETRFSRTGMERRTTSDLGFIGWLITQFAAG